jgi:pimeloyl-ACP methyl ester carboxylesterase
MMEVMRLPSLSFLALVLAFASPVIADAKPKWQELPLPPAMPKAATEGRVDVGGASIYYAIYGKGDPVILLHGGLGNSDHFSLQVPALADKFQVIVIDSRGQGRSTLTRARLSYHAMAGDVLAVMDKLELAKAALVGWSDGGEIALDLAIHHPERVSKLFVFGANYDSKGSKPRGGPSAQTFNAYAAKCRADYQKLSKTPRAYAALVDAMLRVWRSPISFTKDQLRGITAPTMVALGDHDEIILLDQIKEMSTLIPNAQLTVFTDTSHFALWQDPTAFNKALVDFLSPPGKP